MYVLKIRYCYSQVEQIGKRLVRGGRVCGCGSGGVVNTGKRLLISQLIRKLKFALSLSLPGHSSILDNFNTLHSCAVVRMAGIAWLSVRFDWSLR